MVGHPRLALALLGLGAVHGLPTQQGDEVEKRGPQFMGPPSSSFGPGDLPRVDPAAPCNPLTDTACWWPFATAPPTTEDGGASFSFGGLPRRDGGAGEKAKRTSVDELKAEIIDMERRLERLQNLQDKTRDDWEEIRWLRRELERVVGIVRIIAPPGTSTTFTPGKRDETHSNQKRQGLMFPGSGGSGNRDPSCPSVNDAARFLDKILASIDRGRLPRWSEDFAIQAFEVALDQCGMGLEEIDDGEGVILEVYRKDDRSHSGGRRLWPRAAEGQYDVSGLQEAHDVMIQTLDNANPSIATWMILKQMEAELAAQGAAPEVAKRQSGGVITIGQGACQLADILALKAALAALSVAYGNDASKLPASIYLIQQVIVSALQICHQDVPGWTSITPGNPQPGGPLIPEKPVPGGSIIPDRPSSGGGSIIPDRPGEGGRIIPDRPGDGGRINPDRPGEGGSIRPSD